MIDAGPILLTLQLAVITTIILLVLSIPLAYWLAFSQNRMRPVVEALVTLPLVLPPTVLGFYLLIAFSPNNWLGGILDDLGVRFVFSFEGLILGSVIFSLPFMVQPLRSGFANLPKGLREASAVLGKSELTTLTRVLLPNIKPALLTGIVLAFAHTVGEFGVVLMIGGNIPGVTKVASIAIYDEVESLNYGAAHLYSLILVCISFAILVMVFMINKRSSKSSMI